MLTYLIALAASLDPAGRWTVLVGAASSLGVACGPLTGATLAARLGYPGAGAVLGATLLLATAPLVAVARRTAPARSASADARTVMALPAQRSAEAVPVLHT